MKRKGPEDTPAGVHQDEDNNRPSDSDSDSTNSSSAQDPLITTLNALPTCQFRDRYIPADVLHYTSRARHSEELRTVAIDFKAASDLSKEELSSCFNLVETTSRTDYEPSSWGWHPGQKRHEMREEGMRYLLVREPVASSDFDGPGGYGADLKGAETVAGFLSFMMTHDSSPSVPVLYIYEIHLEAGLRRSGLGAHLMGIAEDIARNTGVEKTMLTCFLSNERALGFYRGRGYGRDVCSPEDREMRRKVVKVDYVIMSKDVVRGLGKEVDGKATSSSGLIATVRDWTSKLAGEQMQDGKDVAHMRGWV